MKKVFSDRGGFPRKLVLTRATIAQMGSGLDDETEATNTMRSIVASNVVNPCGCIAIE